MGEGGQISVVRRPQMEERRGEMNLTGTVGFARELGSTAGEVEEGREKRAGGRVEGDSSGNLEEGLELAVEGSVMGYD